MSIGELFALWNDPAVLLVLGLLLGLVIMVTVARMIWIVPEHERVALRRMGGPETLCGPGLVLVIPLIDRAHRINLHEPWNTSLDASDESL